MTIRSTCGLKENFYGFAAYFGKTQRIENQFTRTIYAKENEASTVLWPPEGKSKASERKPVKPAFPFDMVATGETPEYIVRLNACEPNKRPRKTRSSRKPIPGRQC